MSRVYLKCVPYDKGMVTLGLEAGVDGVDCSPRGRRSNFAAQPLRSSGYAEDLERLALDSKAEGGRSRP